MLMILQVASFNTSLVDRYQEAGIEGRLLLVRITRIDKDANQNGDRKDYIEHLMITRRS